MWVENRMFLAGNGWLGSRLVLMGAVELPLLWVYVTTMPADLAWILIKCSMSLFFAHPTGMPFFGPFDFPDMPTGMVFEQ